MPKGTGHRPGESPIDAFLLLKPDCLRQGLTDQVERAIQAQSLEIDDRFNVSLTPADVRMLWAEYDDEGHRLTLAFLDRYLTTAPSEVLLVSGPDAFEAARRVKRKIRSMYAAGPYANLVHAAEQRGELDRQRRHLTGHQVGPYSGLVQRRPPGDVTFDVAAVVDEVWPLIQGMPEDPGPVRLDDGSRAVFLSPDRDHTLDSTVTALCRALPRISPRQAVLLALRAGFTGGTPVAAGDRAAVRHCLRALREHGIRNCWTDRWQPAGRQKSRC
ncbi:nucleoside-diphosphate kinase [Actinoplanes derwentensis]|uniref:Nucleoside diphosphate kinase n=1 Tax=Actinoplanes derwentensis TaxID=113562 RepID=A0A1H1QXM9_9ACTN|nr:nucleoside-diphosphate kinase [Actinoplanes derwentensis]GID87096.1 hypothetical protein Ade03nite_60200 [Actinoplanes derwentensis]SDS28284.1 Nucleoside diphosphate kinase [Actinoplanes derwentensis]